MRSIAVVILVGVGGAGLAAGSSPPPQHEVSATAHVPRASGVAAARPQTTPAIQPATSMANATVPTPVGRAPLSILHIRPEAPVDWNAPLVVTFDRPVAPRLDESVDPTDVFRIEPKVEGDLFWRDPASLVFVPDALWDVDTEYAIHFRPDLEAMDGTRLEGPHIRAFHTAPPGVLSVVVPPNQFGPKAEIQILVDAEVPLERVVARAQVRRRDPRREECLPAESVLRPVGARPLSEDEADAQHLESVTQRAREIPEGPARDERIARARLLEFETEADLVRECRYQLFVHQRLPAEQDTLVSVEDRDEWRGPQGLGLLAYPGIADARCYPEGGCQLSFKTAMDLAIVRRGVRVFSSHTLLTGPDSVDVNPWFRWTASPLLIAGDTVRVVIGEGVRDQHGQRLESITQQIVVPARVTGVQWPAVRMVAPRDNDWFVMPATFANANQIHVVRARVPRDLEITFLKNQNDWFRDWTIEPESMWVPVPRSRTRLREARVPLVQRKGADKGGTLYLTRLTARISTEGDTTESSMPIGSLTNPVLSFESNPPREVTQPEDVVAMAANLQIFPVAVVQATDLAVHTQAGIDEALVWVTDARTGRAQTDVDVTLFGPTGELRAEGTTDSEGTVTLSAAEWGLQCEDCAGGFEGYVAAETDRDRALGSIAGDNGRYRGGFVQLGRPQLASRPPLRLMGFTERDLYRPGDSVFAKAILRVGARGNLELPVGDSIRWLLKDPQGELLLDSIMPHSRFGTTSVRIGLDPDGALGEHVFDLQLVRGGRWQSLGSAPFGVEAFRPQEFELAARTDTSAMPVLGDSVWAEVQGDYLFDAPMAGAELEWSISETLGSSPNIPLGDERGWQIGAWGDGEDNLTEGSAQLDGTGRHRIWVTPQADSSGYGRSVHFTATVLDANRQELSTFAHVDVHAATLYPAARMVPRESDFEPGLAVSVDVIAVALDGARLAGVDVVGHFIYERPPYGPALPDSLGAQLASGDTLGRCRVTTTNEPSTCTVIPPAYGTYKIEFRLRDARGRPALTRFWLNLQPPLQAPVLEPDSMAIEVKVDKPMYQIGDTLTVTFDTPFERGYALVSLQQERILENVRIDVSTGTTSVRFPVPTRFAPGGTASVTIVEARPATARNHAVPRSGSVAFAVTPEDLELMVEVASDSPVYAPGDSARIEVRVRDKAGAPAWSEIAIWAVDEGVLSLEGFSVPNPFDVIYAGPQATFWRNSNLNPVAGWMGRYRRTLGNTISSIGLDEIVVTGLSSERQVRVRSDFRSTAFFAGSVVTGEDGHASVDVTLPDNLTTYRLMAVAVDEGRRFGAAESQFVVEKTLAARPALPRFVRPGDVVDAGAVINSKVVDTIRAEVSVVAEGVDVLADASRVVELAPNRAYDARFAFKAIDHDSARFTFQARGGGEADAVRIAIPFEPKAPPIFTTAAGRLRGTEAIEVALETEADVEGATLEIGFGSSPLGFIAGLKKQLDLYPYYCSEQLSSSLLASVALFDALESQSDEDRANTETEIRDAIKMLIRRQRPDGGIAYWNTHRFTSPSITAYVGRTFLEARSAEFAVPDSVLSGIGDYLDDHLIRYLEERDTNQAHDSVQESDWVSRSIDDLISRYRWTERAASVDMLGRLGRPNHEAEDALFEDLSRLEWTDRLVLAQALSRRGDLDLGASMLEELLEDAAVEGRTLNLPDEATRGPYGYFRSWVAPLTTLIGALVEMDPDHALLGPAVESVVAWNRAGSAVDGYFPYGTTYDKGLIAQALSDYNNLVGAQGPAQVAIHLPGGTLQLTARDSFSDTTVVLTPSLVGDASTFEELELQFVTDPDAPPVFFYATIQATPSDELPDPLDEGIGVERWYEDVRTGNPTVSAAEGDLVRVRLRVTLSEPRTFVVVDDPLPAGLEVVSMDSYRRGPFVRPVRPRTASLRNMSQSRIGGASHSYWYSPWTHREKRDDRAIYSAIYLWPGVYDMEYLARATTAGTYLYPPAHSEEMYNPSIGGRSAGGRFTVSRRPQ